MKFPDLDRYDYTLPPELIRKEPLEPRDSARLFVYDTATDTVELDTFCHVARYLPEHALVVLNDTRVVPARLWLKKPTGGKVEVFVLMNEWDGTGLVPALVDRKVSLGDELSFPDGSVLIARKQQAQRFFFELTSASSLSKLLERYGTTPVPHYLEGSGTPEVRLRERYQTVFAASGASVAAPTASLHFSESVFASLEEKQIATAKIRLDVGQGTFAPLREENFATGRLHPERVTIGDEAARALNTAKTAREKVVAVGTTVTRSLESFGQTGSIEPGTAPVDLFIYPPYRFHMTDILITNFHLPKTSLMLLVDAFLEHRGAKRGVVALYQEAIREGFSFYSFGDSMLIR